MPSQIVTKNRYRRAKCCGTCLHEKNRYCGVLCMDVKQDFVCDNHKNDPARSNPAIFSCKDCAFGPEGDKTCKGVRPGNIRHKPCFSGKPRTRRKSDDAKVQNARSLCEVHGRRDGRRQGN